MINVNFFYHLGQYFTMLGRMFSRPEKQSMYWKETMRQMNDIGVGSIIIVGLIAIFIGMVTSVQFAYQLAGSSIPIWYIGYIVRDMMIIELAPTFSCLALAGKVGSNIAAEIGGMRQKEQIDALEIMGVETAAYLIRPRIVAALIVVPLLVIVACALGIFGGYIAGTTSGFITPEEYNQGLRAFFVSNNVTMMLVKAFVFAFLITTVSAYQGFFVKGGSIELGKASTQAVVYSNVLILLADFIIAKILT